MVRQIATVYSKKSNRRGVVLKRGCLLRLGLTGEQRLQHVQAQRSPN
ncbi:TPA: hypothetical protein JLQ69_003522 [Escherichia coli]|nr:hypothetical protein [Escherichia coli]